MAEPNESGRTATGPAGPAAAIVESRQARLFVALAGLFITNALIAEFVGVKIFAMEDTLGIEPLDWRLFGQSGSLSFTAGVMLWPVVFIMTDDHAAHAMSCYGSKINQTPQLDRLDVPARPGVASCGRAWAHRAEAPIPRPGPVARLGLAEPRGLPGVAPPDPSGPDRPGRVQPGPGDHPPLPARRSGRSPLSPGSPEAGHGHARGRAPTGR